MLNEKQAGEAPQMTRKHVVCINESPEFLEILRELLQEQQYDVTTTNYVPETFDVIDVLQPDLIIADLVIGQRAGWGLLEQLNNRASTQGIPVIITSTDRHLLDQAEENPERFGGTATVLKPVDLDDLLETVYRLIDQR